MYLFFLLVASAFAKQNFRVTNGTGVTKDQALAACFSNTTNSLCTYTTGCCNGHGVCSVSTGVSGLVATCVCDALPSECHGASTYNSSAKCATIPSGAVCCDGNDVDFLESGNCHDHNLAYPEHGAKGTLLRRVGDEQRYADNYASIRTEDVDAMANDLLGLSYLDNSVHTSGNMLGLGFLEVAIKDIVHYAYYNCAEKNKTFDGVTYPAIKWQENTGISGSGYSIPKAFENTATSVIDLGPLYDYAPRINGGVYVDINAAINYWNLTHHVSREFLVVLRYYARYHYYMARSIEEYLFGGQNSTYAPVTRVSSLGNWTTAKDTIYQQARRSTIRFSQAVVEQTSLQLLLENPFDLEGYQHAFFDQYFRGDEWQSSFEVGATYGYPPTASVRSSFEFAGDRTRLDLSHLALSGLDFLLALRNPAWDTTHSSLLQSANCDSITPADPTLTWEVLSLQYTQLARFGSKINSAYSSELKLNLWRAAELGLGDYALHVSKLTNVLNTAYPPSVSDLNTTAKAYNVYYGAMKEKNPARQYRERTASVAFASYVPINDVIMRDRTSYFARSDTGVATGHLYHSKIFVTPDDGTSFFTYCYKVDNVCTQASTDAAVVIFATHPNLNDVTPIFENGEENQFMYRSRGGLFSAPGTMYMPQLSEGSFYDFDPRRYAQNQFLPEFINPLYYHYDGLNTLAVKQAGSDSRYLHNQIVDAFATSVSFTGAWDGTCYTESYVDPVCDRPTTNVWNFNCWWNWPM